MFTFKKGVLEIYTEFVTNEASLLQKGFFSDSRNSTNMKKNLKFSAFVFLPVIFAHALVILAL
jgi:hypothetical protein